MHKPASYLVAILCLFCSFAYSCDYCSAVNDAEELQEAGYSKEAKSLLKNFEMYPEEICCSGASSLDDASILAYTSGHISKWLCTNCDYEKRGGPKLKICPQCKAVDSHYLVPTWEDP